MYIRYQEKYVQEKIQESKSGSRWLYFGVIFEIVCSLESMSVNSRFYQVSKFWGPVQ